MFVESSDDDKIVQYKWEEVKGPLNDKNKMMSSGVDTPVLQLKSLVPGIYTFKYAACTLFFQIVRDEAKTITAVATMERVVSPTVGGRRFNFQFPVIYEHTEFFLASPRHLHRRLVTLGFGPSVRVFFTITCYRKVVGSRSCLDHWKFFLVSRGHLYPSWLSQGRRLNYVS